MSLRARVKRVGKQSPDLQGDRFDYGLRNNRSELRSARNRKSQILNGKLYETSLAKSITRSYR